MEVQQNNNSQGHGDFDKFSQDQRKSFRSRQAGSSRRDSTGFRIRLSDNEMRHARSLQEIFNLRSTVAVLGFALRTFGEMIEEGKLDDFIKEYRSNPEKNNQRRYQSNLNHKELDERDKSNAKINPFARPSKPSNTDIITEQNKNKNDDDTINDQKIENYEDKEKANDENN